MIKQYKLRFYNFRLVLFLVAISAIGIILVGSARDDLRSKQLIGVIMGLHEGPEVPDLSRTQRLPHLWKRIFLLYGSCRPSINPSFARNSQSSLKPEEASSGFLHILRSGF